MAKEYKGKDITVTWDPERCIHSEKCWRGLSSVFQPKARPWIQIEGKDAQTIADQIDQCPSKALGYYFEGRSQQENTENTDVDPTFSVEVIPDGPYKIAHSVTIRRAGSSEEVRKSQVFLCRCGYSNNKPYCDGAHKKQNFKG